ncbi:hypothetical protein [Leucobacter salsicius]|uniref:hypothetical protein n=1 Tax=Leucobacter salsicius TaxID=664638 RepID=UPI00036FF2AF|nr:hypothetical protein [Leucobacter salsicius]
MCRSKSDGGQRCLPHTKQKLEAAERREERAIQLLEKMEQQLQGELTPAQRERLEEKKAAAGGKLEENRAWIAELAGSIEEIGRRKTERAEAAQARREAEEARKGIREDMKQGGEGTPPRIHPKHQRLNLTESEMGDLRERATAAGKSVTAFVEDLLTRPPLFTAVSAGDETAGFIRLQSGAQTNVGRRPQSSERTIASSPTVSLSDEARERAEAEAEVFNLTVADLIRRRVLGIDPRQRGSHMAKPRQKSEVETFAQIEHAAQMRGAVTSEKLTTLYEGLIQTQLQRTRKAHGKKVSGEEAA